MNNEKEFTPEERSAMCDSIDESQNGPDSTSKAVPPQGLTRFDVTFADKIARHPEGNFMFYADHAAEIERLSKHLEARQREIANIEAINEAPLKRAEAAESKLSQLQLVLESDASGRPAHLLLWEAAQALDKQGSGPLVDCLKIMSSQLEQLAILNGGQQ